MKHRLQPQYERLKELLEYDASTGKINNRKTKRVIIPDHDGLVIIFDNQADIKSKKYKLEKIAYYLAFGVYPKDEQKVLHKNLNPNDNRLNNLVLVSRVVFLKIKEAHKNISGGIRIVPHPTDMFCYFVYWYSKGSEVSKMFDDIGFARVHSTKLQLKYSKILTNYCLFD